MSDGARSYQSPPAVDRLRTWGLAAGVVGAVACGIGLASDGEQFYRSLLVGNVYWVGLALGCLGLLMIYHLTGGDWGAVSRRVLEAGAGTLPLFLLLFLPLLLFGMESVYPWTDPEVVAGDHLLEHKEPYLNVPSFTLRTILYFAVWIGLAGLLSRLSARQDASPDPKLVKRMQAISAPGLILYVLAATFASYDWLMSLVPNWYSTMYGVYFVGTHGIGALAFLILVGAFLAQRKPMDEVLAPRHFHDWGKLLFAFVILWAYFTISQFLIIWSGNLPDEIAWYLPRFENGWLVVATGLLLFHFGLPFLLLLSRDLKQQAKLLAGVALFLLVMRWVDLYWQVAPAHHPEGLYLSWIDLAATLAVGGLWFATFVWLLSRRPLVPVGDPYLEEAMGHGGGHG